MNFGINTRGGVRMWRTIAKGLIGFSLLASPALSTALDDRGCGCVSEHLSEVLNHTTSATVFIQGAISATDFTDYGRSYLNGSHRFWNFCYRAIGLDPYYYSAGSGVLISSDGYILTNAHIVGGTTDITVRLSHGNQYLPASLVGLDIQTDLAILKIEGEGFPYLRWGNSDALEQGEQCFVHSMTASVPHPQTTVGVVNTKGQLNLVNVDLDSFIHLASIYSTVSGSPVVDWRGTLIGIINSVEVNQLGNSLTSFAIPSRTAAIVVKQLLEHNRVMRGYLGVTIEDEKGETATAVHISRVATGSPADKVGLQIGDLILSYNHSALTSSRELRKAIARTAPETEVTLTLTRRGEILQVPVVLASDEELAPYLPPFPKSLNMASFDC